METIVLIECESGRWVAYQKGREDIIANGDTEDECLSNLNEMIYEVNRYESNPPIGKD